MDKMLELIRANNIKAADVQKVEIGGNQTNVNTLFRHHPMTGLEAKFSMEYAVSILLVDGKAGLGQFTDEVVQRPDVQDMIGRSRFFVDADFNKRGTHGESLQATLVEPMNIKIYEKDGSVITGLSGAAKGSPENPMTFDEVADKFRGNADFAKWPKPKAESVIEMVKSIETVPDMGKLAVALSS
jgi:2-methylcitrate dehydratase PrpD